MPIFLKYLQYRAKYLLLLLFFAAVFFAVFALFQISLLAVGYALLICLFFALIIFAADFSAFRKKHAALQALAKQIALSLECLPPPHGLFEEDYQVLLKTLFADRAQKLTQLGKKQTEAQEYFTLWAHQIKTPIAAMRLLLQSGEPDPALLSAELFKVEQYVEMALCYLRLDAPSGDYVIRSCALDGVIRQAIRKYAPLFIAKKLQLHYEPTGASALTDAKWLLFLLEQVLGNAVKYTPAGSVTIAVRPGPLISVKDTGVGIAPSDLPRIFERGYTGLNGHADSRSTGIGLYLCRRIAKRLGHSISALSAPGEGTEIVIDLSRRDFRAE